MPPELQESFDYDDLVSITPTSRNHNEVILVTDPYSTGCMMVKELLSRNCSVIAIWTLGFVEEMKTHVPKAAGQLKYLAQIDEVQDLQETAWRCEAATQGKKIIACIAGGEAGVDLADRLSEYLGLCSNGTQVANRRDKVVQQELIRKAGVRAVRQASGMTFSDVEAFLNVEAYPIVLKPTESAGSDGVKLCHSLAEAKAHFELLMRSQLVNGGQCPAVVCQEYLKGKEYIVDTVSCGGEHKTTMLWVYDKRPANDSAFVYFGEIPVDSESPEARILMPYVYACLNAIGVKHGPCHTEVILTTDGPCLVEVNCRANGGDGNWLPLARALTGGYSQVDVAVSTLLDADSFKMVPNKPPSPYLASGLEVQLVSFFGGTVKATPGFDEIRKMASYVFLESGFYPGSLLEPTIDLITCPGSVILMHRDEEILQRDLDRIRQLERENLMFVF